MEQGHVSSVSCVLRAIKQDEVLPLSEISKLEMLGISAMQPSRIWEPPDLSCSPVVKQKTFINAMKDSLAVKAELFWPDNPIISSLMPGYTLNTEYLGKCIFYLYVLFTQIFLVQMNLQSRTRSLKTEPAHYSDYCVRA